MNKKSIENNPLLLWKKKFETETKVSSTDDFLVSTDEDINIKPLYIQKDINNLNMSLDVNGERMQSGNTNTMVFNVDIIVSYVSKFMSLQAGDIITTGTPPGVGMGKKPQLFLKAGDKLRLSIENLGEQNSKVVPL